MVTVGIDSSWGPGQCPDEILQDWYDQWAGCARRSRGKYWLTSWPSGTPGPIRGGVQPHDLQRSTGAAAIHVLRTSTEFAHEPVRSIPVRRRKGELANTWWIFWREGKVFKVDQGNFESIVWRAKKSGHPPATWPSTHSALHTRATELLKGVFHHGRQTSVAFRA
jgi:hypothetical protein